MRRGTCRHFVSPHHEAVCRAGVNVREITGGPDPGWLVRIPCHRTGATRDGQAGGRAICDRYEEPKPEEIAEYLAWLAAAEARMDRLAGLIERLKRGGTSSGAVECPECKGELRWALAGPRRHIRMRCRTEGCVTLIE